MNVKEALFALLRSEVFDEPLENGVENCIRSVDLSALFSLAKRHDVAHLIGSALGKIDGVTATETTKKLKQEHFLAGELGREEKSVGQTAKTDDVIRDRCIKGGC